VLVLTRKIGECVCIGEEMVITVLAKRGGHVRLGITAPRDITVCRQEVEDRNGKRADAVLVVERRKDTTVSS
jgi:carbon storage regulator